ncbi:MAG: putative NAD/FAD-binding protein [Flavobacteriales bacterium]|jgi:predicted NAD/FAD-binding protein
MLEFSKVILKKVSFDTDLFRKELIKSISWLSVTESKQLKSWCLTYFGIGYHQTIMDVFNTITP